MNLGTQQAASTVPQERARTACNVRLRVNMKSKRPVGFTILAIMLWWLTFAGVGNAALRIGGMHPLWPLAYAATAFVTGLGLWRNSPWCFHAFLAWSGVVVLLMIAMQWGRFRAPLPLFAGFACLMLILLSTGAIYIKKRLRTTVEPVARAAGGPSAQP